MDAYDKLLLDIYYAARMLPPDEFPPVLMAMLRAAIGFDFARLLSADLQGNAVVIQGSIMYNIPTDNALDWEGIQRQDLVLPRLLAKRGTPIAFHSPTLFAAPAYSLMRDYVQRYEHRNGLAMILADADTGLLDGLSLYRADADARFGERQLWLVRAAMPHIQEALKVNRLLATPAPSPSRGALLIAQTDGLVQHCATAAVGLMLREWPDWRRTRLPETLLESVRSIGGAVYRGQRITIQTQVHNTLMFLRLSARTPLMQLSQRELQVASLYGQGRAAKEVASTLGITPATARNTLQRIYQKLDVHDKAALAQRLINE